MEENIKLTQKMKEGLKHYMTTSLMDGLKKALDDALDSMEDGYNTLEEVDGEMYEVYENNDFRITRMAYL